VHKDGWSNHFLEIVNLRDQRLVEYEVVPDVQQIVNDLDSQMSDNYSKIIILTEKNWVKVKELLLFQQRRIKDLEMELDHGT
jgi:tetraacyldisaccharide-1-P 4'-kinase